MTSQRRTLPRLEELVVTYRDVQLATLVESPPQGGGWSFEPKWDGYRILALRAGTNVRLASRRHQDWTDEFDAIARAVARIPKRCFVLDGEVCALDARGVPSFQLLQKRAAPGTRLAYLVFDLLCDDGEDVRARPIEERRRRLAALVGAKGVPAGIALSSAIDADARVVLDLACRAGLEGVVAKQKGSPYVAGRTRTWLKIKCGHRQEFAIVGWLPYVKSQALVGSLVLGLMEGDGRFHFAGKVGTGFDQQTRKSLHDLLAADATNAPTAVDVPRFGGLVRFVVPRLVAEVSFTEWTSGGHVRHPSFQGLRPDKKPADCRREVAAPTAR